MTDLEECPLPSSYPHGECDVLLRADDIVHDDLAPVKAQIVRKAFRGFGLGRALAEAIVQEASRQGYATVLLDTLDDMEAARSLYEELGFVEIPPYYHSPYPGAHYLKATLG